MKFACGSITEEALPTMYHPNCIFSSKNEKLQLLTLSNTNN